MFTILFVTNHVNKIDVFEYKILLEFQISVVFFSRNGTFSNWLSFQIECNLPMFNINHY